MIKSYFSVSVYCELLACYLASHPANLIQAKFLMQRVPDSVLASEDSDAVELKKLWNIGKAMWNNNTPEVYNSLGGPWSASVQKIVDKVYIELYALVSSLIMI